MDPITTTQLQEWVKKHDWTKFGEQKTPEGYVQEFYVTPAGNITFAIVDKDIVKAFAIPMPPPPSTSSQRLPPGLNIPGLNIGTNNPPYIGHG